MTRQNYNSAGIPRVGVYEAYWRRQVCVIHVTQNSHYLLQISNSFFFAYVEISKLYLIFSYLHYHQFYVLDSGLLFSLLSFGAGRLHFFRYSNHPLRPSGARKNGLLGCLTIQ